MPSSPYTSPDDLEFITTPLDWRGGRRSTNRKKHLLLIFKSHAYVCEWTGVGRVVIAGKELAQQCGGPRPRLPPNDPHPCTDFCGEKFRHGDNSLDKITTTDMSCVATSSTVKDDVSALFWVLGFHLNKVLRISTAQEESDINSTSTQKYKNTCLL